MRSLFLFYGPSESHRGLSFVSLSPYIRSDGLYGHFFGGERIIELWIYVCLPGPLQSTHRKVKAAAAQTVSPSHRSAQLLTAYFDKSIKFNDSGSAEELEEIQRGKKRMFKREPSPNCSLKQVNCEK